MLFAGTAGDTFFGKKGKLDIRVFPLGIVAPVAIQITALEKQSGADAGTVYGRASFDIKNKRIFHRFRYGS